MFAMPLVATFSALEISSLGTACASIEIVEDSILESDHSFIVSLSGSSSPPNVTYNSSMLSTTVIVYDNGMLIVCSLLTNICITVSVVCSVNYSW